MNTTTEKELLWRIWSMEHKAWWNPLRCGYTRDEKKAGLYNFADSCDIVRLANAHSSFPQETMIPVFEPQPEAQPAPKLTP